MNTKDNNNFNFNTEEEENNENLNKVNPTLLDCLNATFRNYDPLQEFIMYQKLLEGKNKTADEVKYEKMNEEKLRERNEYYESIDVPITYKEHLRIEEEERMAPCIERERELQELERRIAIMQSNEQETSDEEYY